MVLNKLILILTLVGFNAMSFGAACGGEGPQPFLNLTLTSKVKKLGNVGEVQDFVFWEGSNTVVYRNNKDEVRVSKLNAGTDVSVAHSRYPLSRVVDPSERFLLASRSSFALDIQNPFSWVRYWSGWGSAPAPIHWNRGTLRMARTEKIGLMPWKVKVWDYEPRKESWSKFRCEYAVGQNPWRIVEGSEHPYLYLYEVQWRGGQSFLQYYRLSTEDCSVVRVGTPSEPLPGKVTKVRRFPGPDALVAEVDHPTLNVRWQSGNRCRYHDLGNEEALFMGNDHPVVATFSETQGMTLFNLETKRMVRAIGPGELDSVDARDLWLTKKGARLLLSPTADSQGRRHLLELEIDPLVPAF